MKELTSFEITTVTTIDSQEPTCWLLNKVDSSETYCLRYKPHLQSTEFDRGWEHDSLTVFCATLHALSSWYDISAVRLTANVMCSLH